MMITARIGACRAGFYQAAAAIHADPGKPLRIYFPTLEDAPIARSLADRLRMAELVSDQTFNRTCPVRDSRGWYIDVRGTSEAWPEDFGSPPHPFDCHYIRLTAALGGKEE